MLLVDAHEPRRRALTADLRRVGYEVCAARTPLGAIARACEEPVGLLVLGRPDGAAGAADLLEYFAEADPEIGRVLICDRASAALDDDLLSLAHVLLQVPWTRTHLRSLADCCAGREPANPNGQEMKP